MLAGLRDPPALQQECPLHDRNSVSSSTGRICTSGGVSKTLIERFVILFRDAGPEIAERLQTSGANLAFLRK
jgi:hypothetical protein